jgi:hypothetical protein
MGQHEGGTVGERVELTRTERALADAKAEAFAAHREFALAVRMLKRVEELHGEIWAKDWPRLSRFTAAIHRCREAKWHLLCAREAAAYAHTRPRRSAF